MARIRTIKPEFWTDEKIVGLPALARLLFIGLWNFCDDHGYFWDEPLRIKLQVLPMDDCDIPALLTLLVQSHLLTELETTTGKRAFLITHFKDHQKVQHPADSKIQPLISRILMNPHESSRVLTPEWKGKEGKGIEGKGKESPPNPPSGEGAKLVSVEIPASLETPEFRKAFDEWREYKREKGQGYKPAGLRKLLKQLSEWGPVKSVQSIEHSMASNYAGLFEPRAGPGHGGSDLFGGLREFVQSGGSS